MGLLAASGIAQDAVTGSAHYDTVTDPQVQLIAKEASQRVNKQLPLMIDSSTRADSSIVGPGRRFTYVLTDLSNDSTTLTTAQLTQLIGKRITNNVCTTNALKLLIENDYLIIYKYFDKNGRLIGNITINRQDCTSGN